MSYFKISEFYPKSVGANFKPTAMQSLMFQLLIETLNPVREELGVPLLVTSGGRLFEDYKRLIKEGYKPSPTSDHFVEPIFVPADSAKRTITGEYYTWSAGAADIQAKGKTAKEVYNTIIKLQAEGKLPNLGQVILESQGDSTWVHVANNLTVLVARAAKANLLNNCKFQPMVMHV